VKETTTTIQVATVDLRDRVLNMMVFTTLFAAVMLTHAMAHAGGTIQLAAIAENIQASMSTFARPAAGGLFISGLIPLAWGRDFNGITIGLLVVSAMLGAAAYAPNLLALIPVKGGMIS